MYAAAVGRRRFFTSYEGFLTAGMTNTETPPYYGISISASVNTRYVVSCGPLWCAVRPYLAFIWYLVRVFVCRMEAFLQRDDKYRNTRYRNAVFGIRYRYNTDTEPIFSPGFGIARPHRFRIYGIFGTVWVWYTSLPRGHWTTIMNAWYYRYRLLALLYLHIIYICIHARTLCYLPYFFL